MNKKMILVPLIVLLMLLSVAPVMAESAMGQKVTASFMFTERPKVRDSGERMITNGGIWVYEGHVEAAKSLLFIGSDSPLSAFAIQVASGSVNTKTDVMIFNAEAVIYISVEGSSNGFSGNVETKFLNLNILTMRADSMQVHGVLQGFGAYSEQTLMLSYEGPPGGPWTGYCLKG